jgi:hypothetical protein
LQDPSADNPEGLSKEELGRLVASRWTGENVNEVNKDDKKGHEDEPEIVDPAEEVLEDELDVPEPAEENYGGYHSEIEDDRHKYEDEEFGNESEDEYVDDHDEHIEPYKSDDDQKGDQYSGMVFFVSALSFFSGNYSRGSPCYGIIFDQCLFILLENFQLSKKRYGIFCECTIVFFEKLQ